MKYRVSVLVEGHMSVEAENPQQARHEAESFLESWNDATLGAFQPPGRDKLSMWTIKAMGLSAVVDEVLPEEP